MRRLRQRNAAMLAAALTLAAYGCAHQYLDPRFYGQMREPIPDHTPKTVQIRFLGVGGFLVQRGTDVVMTAPFYTNPDETFLLGTKQVQPNKSLIKELLPARWVKDTAAILVGHTHYDHFMDVPYVATELAKDAVLYGSVTMKQLAMAPGNKVDETRIVTVSNVGGQDFVDYRQCSVEPKEGCHYLAGSSGDWIKVNARVRIRALCSRHAPVPGLGVPFKGCLSSLPLEPKRAGDWKLGDTYAYLIDFLDSTTGKPDFRVYYQDSATAPTFGFVPPELTIDKRVDVALLCGAGFNAVKDNPERIMKNTDPRYVIFGHWENFFKPQTKPLESLPYFDYSNLVARMDALASGTPPWKGKFWVAAPGNLFVFEPE